MKKSPFDPGPPEELTAQEIEAMTSIKQGRKVEMPMYQRLEMLDLARANLGGWALTPAGDWRLSLGR